MTVTQPLNRASVLAAALAVLDERGLAGLSLRSLAARLGVSPMAPYKHYANKAELLDALAAYALEPLGGTDLEAAMRELYARLVEHPGLIGLFTLQPRLPHLAEARRDLLERGVASADDLRRVTGYVIGYAMLTPEGDDAFHDGLRRLLDAR